MHFMKRVNIFKAICDVSKDFEDANKVVQDVVGVRCAETILDN